MKISNSYMFDQATKNIQTAQSDVSKSREKIASGKSLVRPSDDTSKLRSIELLKSQQRKVESYDNSMNFLQDRYKLEESVLSSSSDILIRIKDLAIQASNDTLSTVDRDIIGIEVETLRDELISIANTRDVSGNYIFSGSKSDTKPFITDGTTGAVTYSGDNRGMFTAVSDSRTVQSNSDGTEIFKPVTRATRTFELKGIGAETDYNFKVGDAVIEFKIASPVSADDIQAKIKSALDSSGISSKVSVIMVSGKPEILLELSGVAGVATAGVAVTQGTSNSSPLTADLKEGSVHQVETVTVGTLSTYNGSGGALTLGDGTTTVTLDYSGGAPADIDVLLANIKAHSNYGDLKFEVTKGSSTTLLYTYKAAGVPSGNATFAATASNEAIATTTIGVASKTQGVDFFKMLGDLHSALTSDVRSDISRAVSELTFAQESIAGSLGSTGAKLNTVQRQQDINADFSLRVDSMLSSEEDLDYAKAVTQFNMEMVRLEATQATFAKVAQLSLFQYI
jgi:flagellar hook-associated protein 3 FlgL